MTARAQSLLTHAFHGMGTELGLTVPDTPSAARRLRLAERWLRAYEDRLSRFIPYSELSRLNAAAGRPFRASPLLFEFVRRCLQLAEQSHGVFDPTVLPALEAAGYDRTFEEVRAGPRRPVSKVLGSSFRSVQLDSGTREITLPPGVAIDSGGLGKGWAADRVARILRSPCLVDLGGDIAVLGRPPGEDAWRIGVQDPFRPDRDLAGLKVADGGVATSSVLKRRWRTRGGFAHHLIDTRTGAPAATDAVSVSVIAGNALLADFHAKVALLKGAKTGLEYLQSQAGVEGLIVKTSGEWVQTPGLDSYLVGQL